MKKLNTQSALGHEITSGTKASEAMLKAATQRLSFRRTRDVLPTKIETSRLILRAPMRGDVPALAALADNKAIAEKLSRLPSPYTRADAIAFVEIFAQRADERPFAITTQTGEFLGVVGFSYAMGQHPELGYWLGEPHWGKGIMSEAVKGLLEAAQATGLYPAVRARALQTNAQSIHVLEKAGFRNIGATIDPMGTNKGQPIFEFRVGAAEMIPVLETRRLVLRPPAATDAPAITAYLNNFAVTGNLSSVPCPYTLKDAQWWLDQQQPDPEPTEAAFAIELPGAGYIGQVGFHRDIKSPTLGYWLAEPFWHRGLMTEAAAAVIDWFFWAAEDPVIHSGVFYFNKASLKVQRKLGFTETGSSMRHCLARGEDVRHIDTELARDRWAGLPERAQEKCASGSRSERATAKDKA